MVEALGLDEVAFLREAPYHRTQFSTSIVDVKNAQLLDVVPGRSGKEPTAWLERQGHEWLAHVRYATLDLSGPYRAVFDAVLPGATLVADPFHVVKLANTTLDPLFALAAYVTIAAVLKFEEPEKANTHLLCWPNCSPSDGQRSAGPSNEPHSKMEDRTDVAQTEESEHPRLHLRTTDGTTIRPQTRRFQCGIDRRAANRCPYPLEIRRILLGPRVGNGSVISPNKHPSERDWVISGSGFDFAMGEWLRWRLRP